jgi:hypothetical protein
MENYITIDVSNANKKELIDIKTLLTFLNNENGNQVRLKAKQYMIYLTYKAKEEYITGNIPDSCKIIKTFAKSRELELPII